MIDRIARALAKADGEEFDANPHRYRRLATAALRSMLTPADAMIEAAHAAIEFDNIWAINSRADFRRAVKAMIHHAITQGE
jgi:hypothetical protein